MRNALVLALAFAVSSPAIAKDYQVAKSCSGARWSLPYAAQAFLAPASDSEARASGMVSGSYSGVKPDGQGGVCNGQVFKVTKSGLRLWRVASSSDPQGAMGGWWSFAKSDQDFTSRAKWRVANAVCKGWNPTASHIFSCRIKPGALLLVGGTQSAYCSKTSAGGADSYAQSPTTQVSVGRWQSATNLSMCERPTKISRWTDPGK